MAYGKKLEDIIGQQNVTQGTIYKSEFDGCTGWMTQTSSTSTKAHILNFSLLGRTYRVSELKGYGFDSICATCSRHYCLIFTKGSAVRAYEDGNDKYLEIGVDISINNGPAFVEYLYQQLLGATEFINHYTQYAYDKDKAELYIYDERDTEYTNDMDFFTSVYKKISKISAVYKGPVITVGQQYNINDIVVTVEYNTGDIEVLADATMFTVSTMIVTQPGDNPVTVTHDGHSCTVNVPGRWKELAYLEAIYTGPGIHLGKEYKYSDVEITAFYDDNTHEFLSMNQCVLDNPDRVIVKVSGNIFTVEYTWRNKTCSAQYEVPGVGIDHIEATYTGPAVFVNHPHDISYVHLLLVYTDGFKEYIVYHLGIYEEDLRLRTEGNNVFTVKWISPDDVEYSAEYIVTGLVITDVVATYTGPEIFIYDNYDTSDVTVKAYVSDGRVFDIPSSECRHTDLCIVKIGDNLKYLEYTDITGKFWLVQFTVPGKKRPVGIIAAYIGDIKFVGEYVKPYEVSVYIRYLVENYQYEDEVLTPEEWFFEDLPVVTEANNGEFVVAHQHDYLYMTDIISVPWAWEDKFRIIAWYEGFPIKIVGEYDPNEVIIYLLPENQDWIRTTYKNPHITIDSYVVSEEGDTWYTVTYRNDSGRVYQDKYPVIGYVPKKYIDVELEVVYIESDGSETDYTPEFIEAFTFDGILSVSWKQFLNEVNDLQRYGLYRAIIPKGCGLSNQYDCQWHVICKDKNTLKATITKIFNEEVKEDGNKEDNQSS